MRFCQFCKSNMKKNAKKPCLAPEEKEKYCLDIIFCFRNGPVNSGGSQAANPQKKKGKTIMAATYDVTTIKRHAYVASFGDTVIAPLASAPRIETNRKVVESTIYENGGVEAVAAHLVQDCATITLETKDISTALELLSEFTLGEDIMADDKKKTLTFTPVAEGEKSLVFPAAYLQPDASYVPSMGQDHVAKLVFKAYATDENTALFTFA